MNPREFLTALWGNPPPGQAQVWMSPKKRLVLYRSLERVTEDMAAYPDRNIYTGAALAAPEARVRRDNRAKAHEAYAIPGLWADADIAHEVHKKTALPPTREAARSALEETGYAPTILIDSGHGLQAWWPFTEPWILPEDQERDRANALTIWWHDQLTAILGKHGWKIDATHDLARVMRLPGTTNHKEPANPVQATAITEDGPRYQREEFLDRMPETYLQQGHDAQERSRNAQERNRRGRNGAKPQEPGNQTQPASGGLTSEELASGASGGLDSGKVASGASGGLTSGRLALRPDAEPPSEHFAVLLTNDVKFRRSWEGSRKDLTDDSPSGYDMSLATIAASADWTDQEIADLIIAKRRKHGYDLKLRETYYANTIAKAREPQAQAQAQENLEEALEQENSEWRQKTLLENLSKLLGVRIDRMVKYLGDPPIYWMETPQGNITIGKIERLTKQRTFRDAIATTTGTLIRMAKDPAWDKRLQALLNCCEEESVGQASSPEEEIRAWVEEYLSSSAIESELHRAAVVRGPFIKDGVVHVFPDTLRRWIEINTGQKLDTHTLGRRLRLLGAHPEGVNMTLNDKRTTRSCWLLPPKWRPPVDD